MDKIYYFAYGSNMKHKQMEDRCKSAKFICRAYLENYDFVYDGCSKTRKGPVANVIPKEGSIVWGGLWEIDCEDLERLDKCEGYPSTYDRNKVIVKDDNNKEYKVWVYLRDQKDLGNPNSCYRSIVIQGARDCGLPDDYIREKLEKNYEN